ncbi:MAG: hypothetical protein ACK4NY_07760 [Spirosomataceae bacterium]
MLFFRLISIPILIGVSYGFYKNPLAKLSSRKLLILLLLMRCGISIIAHEILHLAYPSDSESYFLHGIETLSGKIPTIDFQTPYSIGFEYLIALAVGIYQSTISIIVLFHLAELLGVWLVLQAIQHISNAQTNKLLLLYYFNPIVFNWLGLGGQDESLLILLFGIFFYLINANKNLVFGHITGVFSLLITKLFAFFIIAAYFIKQKLSQKIVFVVSLFVVVGLLQFVLKIPVFSTEFSRNGAKSDDLAELYTSGNIWFLLQTFGLDLMKTKLPILLALAGLGLFSLKNLLPFTTEERGFNQENYTFLAIGYFLIYNLLYKMTFSQYHVVEVLGVFLLLTAYQRSLNIWFLWFWSGLVAVDGTLFYFLKFQHPEWLTNPIYVVYQILIVLSNFYLFFELQKAKLKI